MLTQVRVIPSLITAGVMLLGLKAINLMHGYDQVFSGISQAVAADKVASASSEHVKPHANSDEPEEQAAHESESHDGEDHDKSGHEKSEHHAARPPKTSAPSDDEVTRSEWEVLESLGDRRRELDRREKEMEIHAKLLEASEQRVAEKIEELKALEQRVQDLLGQKEEEEETKIASLVKVYESMKAKQAARIFEKLEMDVLLPVAERMKEQKIAAILAKMDPTAAKQLTVGLAQDHLVDEDVLSVE